MNDMNIQNQNCIMLSDEPLVDIRDISVDKNLSREERIAEYVRQIKNPYCFRCGNFTVRAQFAENVRSWRTA